MAWIQSSGSDAGGRGGLSICSTTRQVAVQTSIAGPRGFDDVQGMDEAKQELLEVHQKSILVAHAGRKRRGKHWKKSCNQDEQEFYKRGAERAHQDGSSLFRSMASKAWDNSCGNGEQGRWRRGGQGGRFGEL
uniref:Uncharacterized protein n=1 Tax=Triticum urartu TaxID=4572 RepID=A0A8R7R8X5_TRIUA